MPVQGLCNRNLYCVIRFFKIRSDTCCVGNFAHSEIGIAVIDQDVSGSFQDVNDLFLAFAVNAGSNAIFLVDLAH